MEDLRRRLKNKVNENWNEKVRNVKNVQMYMKDETKGYKYVDTAIDCIYVGYSAQEN